MIPAGTIVREFEDRSRAIREAGMVQGINVRESDLQLHVLPDDEQLVDNKHGKAAALCVTKMPARDSRPNNIRKLLL